MVDFIKTLCDTSTILLGTRVRNPNNSKARFIDILLIRHAISLSLYLLLAWLSLLDSQIQLTYLTNTLVSTSAKEAWIVIPLHYLTMRGSRAYSDTIQEKGRPKRLLHEIFCSVGGMRFVQWELGALGLLSSGDAEGSWIWGIYSIICWFITPSLFMMEIPINK